MGNSFVFGHTAIIGAPNGRVNRCVYHRLRENPDMDYDGKVLMAAAKAILDNQKK